MRVSPAMKLVTGLENRSGKEQLRELELHTLENRKVRADLIAFHNYLEGCCGVSLQVSFPRGQVIGLKEMVSSCVREV